MKNPGNETNATPNGFGIIEVIIAMGLMIVIATVGVTAIVQSLSTTRLGDEQTKASTFAQEGIEAVRSIRNQGWPNLTPGTYGLDNTGGSWTLVGGPDTNGNLTRTITVSEVERNGDGDIVQTGGTVDPDTFLITSTVIWDFTPTRSNTIEVSAYLTNYEKPIGQICGAFVTGDQTTDGANLNTSAAFALSWDSAVTNPDVVEHDTGQPTRLTIQEDGDYLFALTLPVERNDSVMNRRGRVQSEFRVNGIKADVGVARSSYIRNGNNHNESSNHHHVLLENLTAGDYVEVFVQGVTNQTGNFDMTATDRISLYVEPIGDGERIFTGVATQTTDSSDLNQSTAYALEWTEQRKDAGYTHDDGANPEEITLQSQGDYLVFVNIPLESTSQRINVRGTVLLDGGEVAGGRFAQGYIRDTDQDEQSSIHWSGVVRTTADDQVLTINVQQEANGGTATTDGENATIYVQRLPDEGIYAGRGTDLTNGSNWNPANDGLVQWSTDDIIDPGVFTRGTPETITLTQPGNYLLVYNDALSAGGGRPNAKATILFNGAPLPGAETKSHYVRGSNNHTESSGSLVYPLNNATAGDTVEVQISREADNDTMNDMADAQLMLWHKTTCDGTFGSVFPWIEDFTLPNGTQSDGPPTAWTVDTSNVGGSATFSVQGNRFEASFTSGEGVWQSEVVDISSESSVDISIDLQGAGGLDSSGTIADYLQVYYILDGGGEVLIFNADGQFNGGNIETVVVNDLTGNTLQIVVRTLLTGGDELYYWDNVTIGDVAPPAPTVTPTATITNTPTPTNTLTPTATPTPTPVSTTVATAGDTVLYSAASNNNLGQYPSLVLLESFATANSIVRFDTSPIPSNATIVSAKVSLYADSNLGTTSTVSMHEILPGNANWIEGSQFFGGAGNGEPSWNYYDTGNTISWAGSAGMSTSGTDYRSTPEDSVTGPFSLGTRYEWDVNPSLVETWISNPSDNHGLFFTMDSGGFMFFGGKDDTDSTVHPELIIDYTTPAIGDWSAPQQTTVIDLSGGNEGWDVSVKGNYMYMLRRWGSPDFYVYDISDITNPVEEATLSLPGGEPAIQIVGNYAYVGIEQWNQEMTVVDISTPTSPFIASSFDAPQYDGANGIFVRGNYAYLPLLNSSEDFVIANISSPTSPGYEGGENLNGGGNQVIVLGSYAYVASSSNSREISVIDVSNPSSPNEVADVNLSGNNDALSIAGFGNTILVGRSDGTVHIYDVSIPTSPSILSVYSAGGRVNSIELGNGNTYMFLGTNSSSQELQVVDISSPSSPSLIGSHNSSGNIHGMFYDEGRDVLFATTPTWNEEIIIFSPN